MLRSAEVDSLFDGRLEIPNLVDNVRLRLDRLFCFDRELHHSGSALRGTNQTGTGALARSLFTMIPGSVREPVPVLLCVPSRLFVKSWHVQPCGDGEFYG
jgi:hypothetical protein